MSKAKIEEKLAQLIPDVNTSTKNPIDLGAIGFSADVFAASVNICIDDPNIDMIVLPLWSFQVSSTLLRRLFKIQERTTKPIIYCFISGRSKQPFLLPISPRKSILFSFLSVTRFSCILA